MQAFFSLGSNLGDRWAHLAAGIAGLEVLDEALRVSGIYETAPVGGPDQGPYLNCVAVAEVALVPRALLAHCQAIENAEGRVRGVRFGPRTLDVDILIYGDEQLAASDLVVPHPRMSERAFVLVPLADLAPELARPFLVGLDTTGVRYVGELVRSPAPPIAAPGASSSEAT